MGDLKRLRRSNRGLKTHSARREMYLFVPTFVPSRHKLGTPHFQRAVACFFIFVPSFSVFSENRWADVLFWANVSPPVFFMNEYINIYI